MKKRFLYTQKIVIKYIFIGKKIQKKTPNIFFILKLENSETQWKSKICFMKQTIILIVLIESFFTRKKLY